MRGTKFARRRAAKEDFSARGGKRSLPGLSRLMSGKTFALRAPGLFARKHACIWSFMD
jgi:hypothetical protein